MIHETDPLQGQADRLALEDLAERNLAETRRAVALVAARQWIEDLERYVTQPWTGSGEWELDGLIRRDELQAGEVYLSSHYGICEAVTVTTSGCHGETTQIIGTRPGRDAAADLLERYSSRSLIPRLRPLGGGRGVHLEEASCDHAVNSDCPHYS